MILAWFGFHYTHSVHYFEIGKDQLILLYKKNITFDIIKFAKVN